MAHSCWVIEGNLIKGLLTTVWARFQNKTRKGTVSHRKNSTLIAIPRPDTGQLFPERELS